MIDTPDIEGDLTGSPPTMEAKRLHWSMLEAKAGQMHMCIIHKQQDNAKEILQMRHGRKLREQETSPIEAICMTQLTQNERTCLREVNLTGETHEVHMPPYALAQSNIALMQSHQERSVALTDGQGIPDQVDGLQEPYDRITKVIQTTLVNTREMDPEKSILVKAEIKLVHPETYSGGLDLKEFRTFVAVMRLWCDGKSKGCLALAKLELDTC